MQAGGLGCIQPQLGHSGREPRGQTRPVALCWARARGRGRPEVGSVSLEPWFLSTGESLTPNNV